MAIRNTARAILIEDGKVLAAKYTDDRGVFYALPGGGQDFGESILENLHRECMEELGIEVEIGELLFIAEKILTWQEKHQIDFIFSVTPKSPSASVGTGLELDPGQLGVEWLPLDDLMSYRLYPLNMRPHLMNLNQAGTSTPVYLFTLEETRDNAESYESGFSDTGKPKTQEKR